MSKSIIKCWPMTLLAMLLIADVVLIGMSLAHYMGAVKSAYFAVDMDRGYAEFFQDLKALWASVLFGMIYLYRRQLIFLVAATLFCYLLIDDAMQVHEAAGLLLIDPLNLQPALGLRARDFGELIFSGTVGLTFIILGALAYRFGDAMSRRICIHLLLSCLALGFFGVGVDMAHIAIGKGTATIDMWFTTIEDGGELLVFSFFTWYAYGLFQYMTNYCHVSLGFKPPEKIN